MRMMSYFWKPHLGYGGCFLLCIPVCRGCVFTWAEIVVGSLEALERVIWQMGIKNGGLTVSILHWVTESVDLDKQKK